MPNLKDLTGQRFGILTVLRIDRSTVGLGGRIKWIVRCDCGTEKAVLANNLSKTHRPSATKSCGCRLNSDHKIPFKNKRLYQIWNQMIQRCENSNNDAYMNYGGRGIKVCGRWHDYRLFHVDVIEGYEPHLTIDRIDNDGHYEPGNTQWVTRTVQNRHNRHTVLTQDDVDFIRQSIMPTAQLARMLKVCYSTVRSARYYKSWK